MNNKSFITIGEIFKKCKLDCDYKIKNIKIKSPKSLDAADKNDISFFNNINYLHSLKKTKAKAVIIPKKLLKYLPNNITPIISENVFIDFVKIFNFFYSDFYYSKIEYKSLDFKEIKKKYKNIKFGINFYVEENVQIGKNVFIGNNVIIKKNSIIGNNVIIGSNVTIENSEIFNNVHICDGAIIGKKGFGFKFFKNECIRIPHIGKVIIKSGCEIGSNCVIDRGSFDNTVIGEDTFIDNLVQIAHNVQIGKRCILAAQVGIAGSTVIGNNVIIGGQAGISGHLLIGNDVKIGGKSGVIRNIKSGVSVMGYPAKLFKDFIKDNK